MISTCYFRCVGFQTNFGQSAFTFIFKWIISTCHQLWQCPSPVSALLKLNIQEYQLLFSTLLYSYVIFGKFILNREIFSNHVQKFGGWRGRSLRPQCHQVLTTKTIKYKNNVRSRVDGVVKLRENVLKLSLLNGFPKCSIPHETRQTKLG